MLLFFYSKANELTLNTIWKKVALGISLPKNAAFLRHVLCPNV